MNVQKRIAIIQDKVKEQERKMNNLEVTNKKQKDKINTLIRDLEKKDGDISHLKRKCELLETTQENKSQDKLGKKLDRMNSDLREMDKKLNQILRRSTRSLRNNSDGYDEYDGYAGVDVTPPQQDYTKFLTREYSDDGYNSLDETPLLHNVTSPTTRSKSQSVGRRLNLGDHEVAQSF